MFKLKRPCVSCPFRKGQGLLFGLRRLDEIRNAPAFQCHATVDYSAWDGPGRAGDHPQQCAGLLSVLWRDGGEHGLNQIGQVAYRLGYLDPESLDPRREAYERWADVVRAHRGEEP